MIFKLLLIYFLIQESSAIPLKFRDNIAIQPYIVNGTNARIEEFPFIVSLIYIYNETLSWHSCGGSILSEDWILTAAHCIYDEGPSSYAVEYSTTVVTEDHTSANVAEVETLIWHGSYGEVGLNDDIGLVKVKSPLRIQLFDFKVRLPLSDAYFATGSPAVLAGWGRIGTDMPISTTLQKVDLQIYDYYECSQIHSPGWVVYNNICAGVPNGGKGQCNGDSGGPLMSHGVQAGIVSWSVKPCTVAPFPGVFTKVAPYIDWIKENSGLSFQLGMFLQHN